MDESLLTYVPIGKENALPSMDIWKSLGTWAKVSVKTRLNVLVRDGVIRGELQTHHGGTRRVYWREKAYDGIDDFAKSRLVGFEAIRNGLGAGHPNWTIKPGERNDSNVPVFQAEAAGFKVDDGS